MARSRLFCLFLVLSCLPLVTRAHADGTPADPDIQVNDPICDSTKPCAPLVGGTTGTTPFTFFSNSTGGGTTTFEVDPTNTSGFFSLDIEVAGAFNVTNCISNKFVCTPTILGGTVTDMFFTESCIEGSCTGGFGPGDVFTIDLDNIVCSATGQCQTPNPGTGGWTINGVGGLMFTAEANLSSAPTSPLIGAPEPSSIFLLCSGAALVATRRKLRRI